jgi:hypothetical protein
MQTSSFVSFCFTSAATRNFVVGAIGAAALAVCTAAQSASESSPQVRRDVRVEAEVHHDMSPPLWQIPPAARVGGKRVHPVLRLPRPPQGGVAATDPALQSSVGPPLLPTLNSNFEGVGNGFTGPQGTFTVPAVPSDSNGSVGPNHYVDIVNNDFAVFNKNGMVIYGPVPINTLWAGFGGLCQTDNDGDPVVVYDRIADRWVLSQFAVTGANGTTTPFLECVAVSQTGDPTGSYNRYSFAYSNFNDYPKMGVWPDAYYITFNMFGTSSFSGAEVCAYDRAKMLAGQAATQQCFNVGTSYFGLLPSSLDGANPPPAGSPNYLLSLGTSVYAVPVVPPPHTDLAFWKFHVDWTTPANSTLTGPTTVTVAGYTLPCNDAAGTCVPQGGTAQQLDTLGDRMMFRMAYRNFGTHESLVVNNSVQVDATGRVGMRWYEIRSPGTTPTIFQQGTYAPNDSVFRWMGSIAMDQAGDMALGFSSSSTAIHPGITLTGRLASDASGTMGQGEDTFVVGAGSQFSVPSNNGDFRWGDYTAMAVDPSDDCSFWYTNQYLPSNGEFNWKTRIGAFKFPNCAANDFSISANPTSLSLAQGAGGSSSISTAQVRGSAETVALTVSGVPNGASASLNPSSVTAGGSSALAVNAGTAAIGTYTLTIIGTAASATHWTTVTLTVTPATGTTSTTLTSTPSPSVFGQSVTLTATVASSSGHPTGKVSFMDGATSLGTGTLNASDQATLVTATLGLGTHSLKAVYGGDANFTGSASSALSQVVKQASSTTLLASSANPSAVGQSVTFAATVVPQFSGTPSGTVLFKDGAIVLGTKKLSGGKASVTTSTLTLGTHSITAAYGGDGNFTASSRALTQSVRKTTSTSLLSSVNPSVFGQAVAFTATVTPNTATGTMTFKDGSTLLGTKTLSGGKATLSTAALTVGSHTITAVYNGSTTFLTSSSSPLSQTVNKSVSKTTVASAANPSVFGQSVTFKATVTAVAPGAGTPTGSVTFEDGGTPLGTKTLSGGAATLVTSSLGAGSHSITAVYGGATNFTGSNSTALTQTVAKAATSTTVSSSANPSKHGSSVTFTATVKSATTGVPTGKVTVKVDTTTVTFTLSGGKATYTTSALPVGSHTITATYVGDANFTGSTSPPLTQTVNP